jgi:hypothetical protein
MLTRRPLYGAAIVLTLALASGLATAVFGIFDATLVRPLPFPADDRLVSIGSRWNNLDYAAVSIPEYLDYRAQARSLESTAAYRSISANLDPGGDGPERLSGAAVTASFFDVLGVPPAQGASSPRRRIGRAASRSPCWRMASGGDASAATPHWWGGRCGSTTSPSSSSASCRRPSACLPRTRRSGCRCGSTQPIPEDEALTIVR